MNRILLTILAIAVCNAELLATRSSRRRKKPAPVSEIVMSHVPKETVHDCANPNAHEPAFKLVLIDCPIPDNIPEFRIDEPIHFGAIKQ